MATITSILQQISFMRRKTGAFAINKEEFFSTLENMADKIGEVNSHVNSVAKQLIWQAPVPNFAALADIYPNPERGWAAMVEADGAVFSFNGSEWKNTGLKAINPESNKEKFYIPAPRLVVSQGILHVVREPWFNDIMHLNPRFVLVKKHKMRTSRRSVRTDVGETTVMRVYGRKGWSRKDYYPLRIPSEYPNSGVWVSDESYRNAELVRAGIFPGKNPLVYQPIGHEQTGFSRYDDKIPLRFNFSVSGRELNFTRDVFAKFLTYFSKESGRLCYNIGGRFVSGEDMLNRELKYVRRSALYGIAIMIDLDPVKKHKVLVSEPGKFMFGWKIVKDDGGYVLRPYWSIS